MTCRICNNSKKNVEYKVKEMMFGFRDEFLYFQCEDCGCLQIAEIPDDISKYYPSNYYSYSKPDNQAKLSLTRFLKKKRDKYAVSKKGLIGKLIHSYKPNAELSILSNLPLSENSQILDVGCGSGSLLLTLNELGFNNLSGVDSFINKDISYDNGVLVHKKELSEVNEKKDLIMFHHCFEHLANPLETLQTVSRLLNKNGHCTIRIPTVSSYAWRHYKEKWVQLDAPRHFYLHSLKSMELLTSKASLKICNIKYDSTEFQFLGSERYLKDLPLNNGISDREIFTNSDIMNYKSQAKQLNKKRDGDSFALILKHEDN